MALFSTCLCHLCYCWQLPQTVMNRNSLETVDLYRNMWKMSGILSLGSYMGNAVRSVLWNIWLNLCQVLRKVVTQCMSVTDLPNVKLSLCTRQTVIMTGKTSNTLEVKDYQTRNSKIIMATIFNKTVDPQVKAMIQSNQLAVLLSDWLECQSEDLDETDGSDGETEWSEDDGTDNGADGVSEMSLENKMLWESFLNSHDPYNLLQFSCTTEDKIHASDNDQDDELICPQEKDETEWSEDEDSDWADEGDLEMSAENRELWESFNSDPYNPLCFSFPTGVKTKASDIEQNHRPSSCTASEGAEHGPELNTKIRTKKVCFNEDVTIHSLTDWGSASQAARDGSCWMELARDRERFKRRVEKMGELISPCLTAQHRATVLDKLLNHSDGLSADL